MQVAIFNNKLGDAFLYIPIGELSNEETTRPFGWHFFGDENNPIVESMELPEDAIYFLNAWKQSSDVVNV
jgi:hypothetical protein